MECFDIREVILAGILLYYDVAALAGWMDGDEMKGMGESKGRK